MCLCAPIDREAPEWRSSLGGSYYQAICRCCCCCIISPDGERYSNRGLTVHEMGPTRNGNISLSWPLRMNGSTYQAELDTRLAVSTVPPRTTSFMPSTTDEPPAPPTRGWMRDLSASIDWSESRWVSVE
jgi:hypothetical protein